MKVSKIKIKNFRSIKDSGEIVLKDNIFATGIPFLIFKLFKAIKISLSD